MEGLARVESERPAATVLDPLMPDQDGVEVLERLRADPRTQRVPVVVLTGNELTPREKRWLTEHAAARLRKTPHPTEGLAAAVQHLVHLSSA